MAQSNYDTIRDAILNRRQLVFRYEGHERVVCPHVLGTKDGQQQALCYQFAGSSSKGPLPADGSRNNWRCIELHKIEGLVEAREGVWHSAPNYKAFDLRCVDATDVQVPY